MHSQGFTIEYGITLGVDAIPFNVGFNLNKGATSKYFYQLFPEVRNAIKTW